MVLTLTEVIIIQSKPEKKGENQISDKKVPNASDFKLNFYNVSDFDEEIVFKKQDFEEKVFSKKRDFEDQKLFNKHDFGEKNIFQKA